MTNTSQQQKEKVLGGLWGAVVGDALGVPVEFQSRERLKANPVVDMREYGTHDQPKGTWSDDSSLMLCTVDSLNERGYDLEDLGQRFVQWYKAELWTPLGQVFDIGIATRYAVDALNNGIAPEQAGGAGEKDNGNGSLMRILPIGLYFANAPINELLRYAERASCLTHRHLRSQMACGIYCGLVAALLQGLNPAEAYQQTIEKVRPLYQELPYSGELPHFEPVLSGKIGEYPEDKIKSSGYVVHSLEASIWCLLTSSGYAEAVLKAVNLGEDTDTTATITGGLAGIYFGLSAIPADWLNLIARKDDLTQLFDKFVAKVQK